ncbi:hypothetical protein ACQKKX_13450, partial [Neorhizobium sp. NPDC001467]
MRTDTGQIVNLADYRPTDFVLERVDLTFELDPTNTKVDARLIFHRREGVDPQAPLVLDGDELKLSGLLFDQREVPASQYDVTPELLTIRDLPAEAPFEITVTTYINPEANTQLMGLYRTNGIYCTQCEAEGFRRITYFPDRPDVLAPYTITIIGDKAANPVMLSNGNFLLPAGAVENLARRTTTGMRSAEFGGLRITDCLVPRSAVLGEVGDGYELSLRSSLLIRGLIPSIVLAGADTALRTVARFAGRSRADGRSSLDVRHVRDVLTGGFLDLLIIDCLALVATRALHLLPRQMSAYAAAAAYLAPKLVAESMDEMSSVLGEETFAQDGAYAMFQKQRRDLPVTSLGHAGSAGRQVSILPQLPYFARHAWFADPEPPPDLFRPDRELPPLDLSQPVLLGDGDPLAATLVACTDLLEAAQPPDETGLGGPALRFLARVLTGELAELKKAFEKVAEGDREALSSPQSFGLADRYTLVLAAAARLGVWREQRSAPAGRADAFLAAPAWVTAVLYRLVARQKPFLRCRSKPSATCRSPTSGMTAPRS